MKWTIGRKIGFGFALAIFALLVVGALAHMSTNQLGKAWYWVERTYRVIGLSEDTLNAMLDAEGSERGYLLTNSASYLGPIKEARDRTTQNIGELRALTLESPNQQRRVAMLESLAASRFAEFAEAIEKKKQEPGGAASQNGLPGKETMDGIRRTVSEMVAEANNSLTQGVTQEAKITQGAKGLTNLGILFAIIVLSLFGVWITRDISIPLTAVSQAAEKISSGQFVVALPSGDRSDEVGALVRTFTHMARRLTEMAGVAKQISAGNLRVEVKPLSEDDVLGNAFFTMIENLHSTIGELSQSANVLASAASEILASTTQVASGAAETSAAVTETTATVEEVKQTAQMSNQKAKYVSESARRATQVAQTGQKTVDASIHGMKRVQSQMESITESVVRLSEQTHAIGEIIATVNDLAEQSNLLAVNAAIEAAKAGERGKGFTIVAQEIKSLAAQSKQATAQVRAILGEIQKATTASVLATEQGSKAVEAGLRESAEAGESIRSLAESIEDAAQAATQISASCQQQVVGTDQVALAMENIKEASSQNLAGTRQAEIAAHSLHDLGQKLKRVLEGFKI